MPRIKAERPGSPKPYTLNPRMTAEHVFVLEIIAAAEDTTVSDAIRLLIERHGRSLVNPELLQALPEDLHDQVPTLWTAAHGREVYDQDVDAGWIAAHREAWHGESTDDDD